jgi:peptidoglycan LD-endopeptidase LytH
VQRRLAAIIGIAFCLGALTALWAARPWERAPHSEEIAARSDDTSPKEAPVGSVGTYGESAGHAAAARPLGGDPVPPLPEPSGAVGAGRNAPEALAAPPGSAAPALPPPGDEYVAPPADLRARHLMIPVKGVKATELQPTFSAQRGTGQHEAIDVLAPKGTPVLAVESGQIVKLFYSVRGGKTIYQFEPSGQYCYYYAHLDSYAAGLAEGQQVKAGQVIGYVGSTGNADAHAPHLHFAIFKLGPEKHWWQGTPIDPYPVLAK